MSGRNSPPTLNPIVRFANVHKSYDGEKFVIKDLNLVVNRGEFLTLLGPSGSGKTTFLMMVAGFESVTSGNIYLNGKSITGMPPHKRGIGMVFQNYALFPHMTVAENLAFPLQVRGFKKNEIKFKIERALGMVQLNGYEYRRPKQLSGGQQQRVAVARALVFDPDLILMDEPLGALDKRMREQMQYEIKSIHKSLGLTVIYVTHDQSEALTMSDRIAVFYGGRVMQVATPTELYEHPKNLFVAQFIGENNAFMGIVRSIEGGTCVVDIGERTSVRAKAVDIKTAGSGAVLVVRPERVLFGSAAVPTDCSFNGEVREITYLGDHIRVRMSLLGHDNFIIKIANANSCLSLHPGDNVVVAWRTEDCLALDPQFNPAANTGLAI